MTKRSIALAAVASDSKSTSMGWFSSAKTQKEEVIISDDAYA